MKRSRSRAGAGAVALEPPSFTLKAVLTFALYWFAWLPGVVANLAFLSEARRVEKRYGARPDGMGGLQLMKWLFFYIPLTLLIIAIVGIVLAMLLPAIAHQIGSMRTGR